MVCLERVVSDAIENGLWCSKREHFLCSSADCLLHYAENDETLLHCQPATNESVGDEEKGSGQGAVPDGAAVAEKRLNPKRPAPLRQEDEDEEQHPKTRFRPARVPCCGSGGPPHGCWYEMEFFLNALYNVRVMKDGGTPSEHDANENRIARTVERFMAKSETPDQRTPRTDVGGTGSESDCQTGRGGATSSSSSSSKMGTDSTVREQVVEIEGANSSSSNSSSSKAIKRGFDVAQRKEFFEGILGALNLRCPNEKCGQLQDVVPEGCANQQCRWCGSLYCGVCFTGGFAAHPQGREEVYIIRFLPNSSSSHLHASSHVCPDSISDVSVPRIFVVYLMSQCVM